MHNDTIFHSHKTIKTHKITVHLQQNENLEHKYMHLQLSIFIYLDRWSHHQCSQFCSHICMSLVCWCRGHSHYRWPHLLHTHCHLLTRNAWQMVWYQVYEVHILQMLKQTNIYLHQEYLQQTKQMLPAKDWLLACAPSCTNICLYAEANVTFASKRPMAVLTNSIETKIFVE